MLFCTAVTSTLTPTLLYEYIPLSLVSMFIATHLLLPPAHTHLQSLALKMRVGMLKMGGFLHSGFDAITAADATHNHDYTFAR